MSNTIYIDILQVTLDYLDKIQQYSNEETEEMIDGLCEVIGYLTLLEEE